MNRATSHKQQATSMGMDSGVSAAPSTARAQAGQAMTEFQICAAYVLVPLFLMVPLVAKYIDIKHATINSARYQAWEYTAWYNSVDDHDIVGNFDAAKIPYKSPANTAKEAERRLFSYIREGDDALAISTADTSGWKSTDMNPLWTNHRGDAIYAGSLGASINTAQDTPGYKIFGMDSAKIINLILNVLDLVFDAFGALLSIIPGSSGNEFSAINTEGYTKVDVSAPIYTYPGAINVADGSVQEGIFARAGVLSEGWNAGGTDHTYKQIGGAIPSTLLKELLTMPVVGEIWDLASFMAPELTRCKPTFHSPAVGPEGSLWLGYVDGDVVHPDRLSGGGTHVCDDAGRCRLVPTETMSHSECQG